jgi:hypothetical protein
MGLNIICDATAEALDDLKERVDFLYQEETEGYEEAIRNAISLLDECYP